MVVVNLDEKVQRQNWLHNRQDLVSILQDQKEKGYGFGMMAMEEWSGNRNSRVLERCDSTTKEMVG